MARFRGTLNNGIRKERSLLGHGSTGLVAEINGWFTGVRVVCMNDDGADLFVVYETGGSNDPSKQTEIVRVRGKAK